jgi:GNAT superfamily N-acetyltransferase
MTEKLHIVQAQRADLNRLITMEQDQNGGADADYFDQCLDKQECDAAVLYLAQIGDHDVGYALLNWRPKYSLFKSLNIPEIQDLNVLRAYRQNGYAAQIVGHCEHRARDKGYADIGIGVGLNRSFGAAQRLYTKLGYRPDGQGISYDRKPLDIGEMRPNDGQLCLMMIKAL